MESASVLAYQKGTETNVSGRELFIKLAKILEHYLFFLRALLRWW
jgi:hypothetical protein